MPSRRWYVNTLTCHTINVTETRKREIVQARQITMYGKAFTKNSLKTIGEHFAAVTIPR